jgi:hypothetical protein
MPRRLCSLQFSGAAEFNFAERMRTGAPGISVNSIFARAAQSKTGLTIVLSGNGIIAAGSLAAAGACAKAGAGQEDESGERDQTYTAHAYQKE